MQDHTIGIPDSYNLAEMRFVENNKIYGLVYFGYRFNTPGFIDRTYDKFAKKVGI